MYVSGRAISTVTSIALGTHCVHFWGIMHILSTVGYSLCTEMALNVRVQYRRVLTVCGNGIKRCGGIRHNGLICKDISEGNDIFVKE